MAKTPEEFLAQVNTWGALEGETCTVEEEVIPCLTAEESLVFEDIKGGVSKIIAILERISGNINIRKYVLRSGHTQIAFLKSIPESEGRLWNDAKVVICKMEHILHRPYHQRLFALLCFNNFGYSAAIVDNQKGGESLSIATPFGFVVVEK